MGAGTPPRAFRARTRGAPWGLLRMQERVKKYAEEVRRSHAAVVKIRVGLNSGEVVVRAIGSDLHMDYTAVGQTTHLAARMEQIADPGAIVITPETLALVAGARRARPRHLVDLDGVGEAFHRDGTERLHLDIAPDEEGGRLMIAWLDR
jgi:class 3 adenylate cyclase